jgi:acyl-CoA dehydrogenase
MYHFESEEHGALRLQARRFAAQHIAPHATAWEEAELFPVEMYKTLADAGLMGIGYPEELGGGGGDLGHTLAASEELVLAGHSVGTVVGLASHAIALPPILAQGSEELKQPYIPPVMRGEQIAALAITEPSAGSDVAGI